MWAAVTTAFNNMITLVGEFLTALTSPATGGDCLTLLLFIVA